MAKTETIETGLSLPLVFSGGGKGGSAKSTTAQSMVGVLRHLGYKHPIIIELESNPRQVNYYGNAIDDNKGYAIHIPVSQDALDDIEHNTGLVYAAFDKATRIARKTIENYGRPAIIDLSANLDFYYASYIQLMNNRFFGNGKNIYYIGNATGRVDAMKDAVKGISYFKQSMINCTCIAAFSNADTTILRGPNDHAVSQFSDAARSEGADDFIYLPRIIAPNLLTWADDNATPLDKLATMHEEKIAEESGIEVEEIARSQLRIIRHIRIWSDAMPKFIPKAE